MVRGSFLCFIEREGGGGGGERGGVWGQARCVHAATGLRLRDTELCARLGTQAPVPGRRWSSVRCPASALAACSRARYCAGVWTSTRLLSRFSGCGRGWSGSGGRCCGGGCNRIADGAKGSGIALRRGNAEFAIARPGGGLDEHRNRTGRVRGGQVRLLLGYQFPTNQECHLYGRFFSDGGVGINDKKYAGLSVGAKVGS